MEFEGRVHVGNCVDVLGGSPEGVVDLTMTSPPYQAAEKLGSACQSAAEPQQHRRNVMQRLGDHGFGLLSETPICLSEGIFNSLV